MQEQSGRRAGHSSGRGQGLLKGFCLLSLTVAFFAEGERKIFPFRLTEPLPRAKRELRARMRPLFPERTGALKPPEAGDSRGGSMTPNAMVGSGLERLREFFRAQIGKGKRFATARDMAAELRLGTSRATILYKFLRGAEPRAGVVLDWLERMGISVLYPEGSCEGVDFIPLLEGRTGAGEYYPSGEDGSVRRICAVDRSIISRLRVDPARCCFLDVQGDSMEPLFSDGSTLLVDCSDSARLYPVDGKIYVVRYLDAVLVKRIRLQPGQITLCSENPLRRPIQIPPEDMDRFEVVGRVRWYSVST